MLQRWSCLDAYDVEIQLSQGTPQALETALISAESAKGRLLTWLRWHDVPKAAEMARASKRHRTALTRVRAWVAEGANRRVVSFFAAPGGLAIFGIGPGNALAGKWLDEFQYDDFRTDYYAPWESQVDDARAGRGGAWELAGALTEFLFDRVGEWLWRALPALPKAGTLGAHPHRLFRSLPLSHCRLPGGRRLSEVFRPVILSPSLFDLVQSLDATDSELPPASTVTALVDADGSLPFARLEGFAVADVARTKTQTAVTLSAVRDTLSEPGIVLLSCHGDFREDNPWESVIMTADGSFAVHEFITDSSTHVLTCSYWACARRGGHVAACQTNLWASQAYSRRAACALSSLQCGRWTTLPRCCSSRDSWPDFARAIRHLRLCQPQRSGCVNSNQLKRSTTPLR